MGELIGQLMTMELKIGFIIVLVLLIGIYALSIKWVSRDAYLRGANVKKWTLIAVIPVAGIIAYCLLRPPLLKIDADEQELEIAVKRRELMKYGECGNCGYPVEPEFVLCPNCHKRLKNLCPTCHHALDPAWSICPYCATSIQNSRPAIPQRSGMDNMPGRQINLPTDRSKRH